MASSYHPQVAPFPLPSTTKRNVSESVKKQVAASFQWRCGSCSSLLESTYQIDHIVPLWKGGSNRPDNLWPLCPSCHAKKTQSEAVERRVAKQPQRCQKAKYFVCSLCGDKLSPYFASSHRCENG